MIANNGSIQSIPEIPDDLKKLYRTVWEISQKNIIKMAADRGAFICQSQSLNIHVAEPNYGKLTSMHFYGWKSGLKTGMYYLRTKAATNAIQFTVDQTKLKQVEKANAEKGDAKDAAEEGVTAADIQALNEAAMVCSIENKEACLMCSG